MANFTWSGLLIRMLANEYPLFASIGPGQARLSIRYDTRDEICCLVPLFVNYVSQAKQSNTHKFSQLAIENFEFMVVWQSRARHPCFCCELDLIQISAHELVNL